MKSSKHYFKQIYRIFLYKFNAIDALLTILLLTKTDVILKSVISNKSEVNVNENENEAKPKLT